MAKSSFNKAKSISATASAVFAISAGLLTLRSLDQFNDPATGEESFSRTGVPFSAVDKEGDARIRRIFSILRQSAAGETILQQGADHRIAFAWLNENDAHGASGDYSAGLLRSRTNISDNQISYVISHEARHAAQEHTLAGALSNSYDPDLNYTLHILSEVDACAASADFTAQHKDSTGTILPEKDAAYGTNTAVKYASMPKEQRDFFKHVVLSCFEELAHVPYREKALKDARDKTDASQQFLKSSRQSPSLVSYYEELLTPVSDTEKAALYRRFFSKDLSEGNGLPEIMAMPQPQFLSWIRAMTRAPDHDRALEKLSADFAQNYAQFQNIKQVLKP